MADDSTSVTIAEKVREQVSVIVDAIGYDHLAAGTDIDVVSNGLTFGLVALSCASASIEHDPACPNVRSMLHAAVDGLLDQLIAYHAGRINQAGETVQ